MSKIMPYAVRYLIPAEKEFIEFGSFTPQYFGNISAI